MAGEVERGCRPDPVEVLSGQESFTKPSGSPAVTINLPPPESMHGYADQFGGTDDPTVKPGDW
jgi:hypothetical protein